MKKKDYEKPTMQVVKLQHQVHLLQASKRVQATMDDEFVEEEM